MVRQHWPIILVLAATFLVYSNIFSNQFVGDDLDFIVHWPTIESFSNLKPVLLGTNPTEHIGTYRPLRNIFFMISYHFFGTNPFGYHTVSLTTHLLTTLLVYLIVRRLSPLSPLPALTALLFGLHPIHTEAVTFVTASYDSIGILFALTSFYLYLLSGQKRKTKNQLIAYYLSLNTGVLALFTNEATLVLPLIISLHYYLYRLKKFTHPRQFKPIFPYIIVAAAYLFIRTQLVKILLRGTYQAGSFATTMLTSLKAILEYLVTYLVPLNLSISHTLPGGISTYTFQRFNLTALSSETAADPSIIITLLILLLLLGTAWFARRRQPLVSFAIGTMLLGLLPVMNFIPTALIFSERYSYLSSVGFVLLLAWLIVEVSHLFSSSRPRTMYLVVAILVIPLAAFYGYLTYHRNLDWSDEITFWHHEISTSPDNSILYYQLGRVYQSRSQLPEAVDAYSQAVAITPDFPEALTYMGQISLFLNNPQSAAQYLSLAIQYDSENQFIRVNLAAAYSQIGDQQFASHHYSEAASAYDLALQYYPTYQPARVNLAQLCESKLINCGQ